MVLETLFIGLVLSLLWTERTEVSPGGIIVPGYFALFLEEPWRAATALAAALLTLALYRAASRHLILFGRRRFAFMVLTGAILHQAAMALLPGWAAAAIELKVIGWVVPGLLASSLVRQKPLPTLASLVAVTGLTRATVLLASLL